MAIVGKRLGMGRSVTDVNFGDDPTDQEIIDELGCADDLVALPSADGWELVVGIRQGRVVKDAGVIVMGAALRLGGAATARRSAEDLTDDQVCNLIRAAFPFSLAIEPHG